MSEESPYPIRHILLAVGGLVAVLLIAAWYSRVYIPMSRESALDPQQLANEKNREENLKILHEITTEPSPVSSADKIKMLKEIYKADESAYVAAPTAPASAGSKTATAPSQQSSTPSPQGMSDAEKRKLLESI